MPLRLIATDVDGTLARDDHLVSERSLAAFGRLAAHGVAGVIVTGRTEEAALATARAAGLTAPVVSCNGALVTDPATGRRLWVKSMDPAQAARVVGLIREVGAQPTVWTPDAIWADGPGVGSDLQGALNKTVIRYGPVDEVVAAEPIVEIMAGGEPALLDRVAPELEARAGLLRSMDRLSEIAPPGAAKEDAVAFLLGHLGVAHEDAWGFGDGENDVAWLALMGRVLVPANGFPGPKAIAHEIIGSNNENGVAEYLETHVLV